MLLRHHFVCGLPKQDLSLLLSFPTTSQGPLHSTKRFTSACPSFRAETGPHPPTGIHARMLSCFSHGRLFATPGTVVPPGSSVHAILQARILEWVAMSSSRGSSQPRDRTRVSHVSCIGRWILYPCVTWEAVCHIAPVKSMT